MCRKHRHRRAGADPAGGEKPRFRFRSDGTQNIPCLPGRAGRAARHDIGGPALIRAAAKNHDFVAVLTDPEQYDVVLAELAAHGGTTLALRRAMAGDAYSRTAASDAAIP